MEIYLFLVPFTWFIVWISNIIHSGDKNFWNENSKENQEILFKREQWKKKQGYIQNYNLRTNSPDEIIDLCSQYENECDFLKDLYSRYSNKKNEYPSIIRDLELEIQHYGDTINEDDIEFINRNNQIKDLKKELKTLELEIKKIEKQKMEYYYLIESFKNTEN